MAKRKAGRKSLSLSSPRFAGRSATWQASVICGAFSAGCPAAVPRTCWLSARAGAAHASLHMPMLLLAWPPRPSFGPWPCFPYNYMLGVHGQDHGQAMLMVKFMAMAMPCIRKHDALLLVKDMMLCCWSCKHKTSNKNSSSKAISNICKTIHIHIIAL